MSDKIDKEAIIDMLQQLAETLERVQWSFSMVPEPDFFYASMEGQDKLDAIGMKLLAIGELLKKIDKKTNKSLLVQYAGIDWTGFIGLRDVIAHDYYNLNPVKIFDICTNEIAPLLVAIKQIIAELEKNHANS
jgi:uncharacterized protein with HEPN domain